MCCQDEGSNGLHSKLINVTYTRKTTKSGSSVLLPLYLFTITVLQCISLSLSVGSTKDSFLLPLVKISTPFVYFSIQVTLNILKTKGMNSGRIKVRLQGFFLFFIFFHIEVKKKRKLE